MDDGDCASLIGKLQFGLKPLAFEQRSLRTCADEWMDSTSFWMIGLTIAWIEVWKQRKTNWARISLRQERSLLVEAKLESRLQSIEGLCSSQSPVSHHHPSAGRKGGNRGNSTAIPAILACNSAKAPMCNASAVLLASHRSRRALAA